MLDEILEIVTAEGPELLEREVADVPESKEQLVSLLVKEPAMKYDWFRMLVQEIRS